MSIRPSHRPTLPRSIRPTPLILASALAVAIAAGSLGTLPAAAQRSGGGRAGRADAERDRGRARHDGGPVGGAQRYCRPEPDLRRTAPPRAGRIPFGCQTGAPRAAGAAPHRLRRDADGHRDALRNHHSRPGHPEPPGRRVTDLRRPAAAHLGSPSPGASRPWRVAAIGRLAAAGPSRQRRHPHRSRRRDPVRHRHPLSRDGGRRRRREPAGQPVIHQDRATAAHSRRATLAAGATRPPRAGTRGGHAALDGGHRPAAPWNATADRAGGPAPALPARAGAGRRLAGVGLARARRVQRRRHRRHAAAAGDRRLGERHHAGRAASTCGTRAATFGPAWHC